MIHKENLIQFPELKVVQDDLEVEYEVEAVVLEENGAREDKIKEEIGKLDELDEHISLNQDRLDKLNKEIDRLTNHSEGADYLVAVGSGVLAGLIDVFWVDEFSLERGRDWGEDKVNQFVKKVAEFNGYEGDDLQGAIRNLEQFGTPSDSNTMDFGGSLQHHLRDFAHHPTLVGLMFSLLTQFTGKSYGTDENGLFQVVDVNNKKLIGKTIPDKFLLGVVHWFLHMVSDMAGSSSTPGKGTGLPGPLLSLAKELSTFSIFQNIKIGEQRLSVWISKLFNGTLLAERNDDGTIDKPLRFDLRAEIGIGYELSRQALPVVINECVVRGFYFIRRLVEEIKEKDVKRVKDLKQLEWQRTLPFKNRTIVRMLTISTGTLAAVDLGDAAIRGLYKSGGNKALFLKEFVLRVNFVGIGRFSIAIGTDATMGMKQQKRRNERIGILGEQLHLMNSKIYYLQASAWVTAKTTEKTINEALEKMKETTRYFVDNWEANRKSMQNIGAYRQGIERHNPKLLDEISDILKWG
ncbi:hypothetical protein D4T97_001905 [Siminovitchia acidinfaciens]|uniref:Uncharacterized protein n=1 Tax=Siminovitchia acidinfaciens TaxID=2321395 RepID=A0A429Y766_9BACI|nr:hypothetical protein [Siminovitchia acidinfaciens]RST77270.1 hypothetical protein D4T97_001905 [Siminovitchia acidinfaciens]